uniref:Glyoxalase n=1 Tax=Parastrongyloides trichosuri TaxID=131310 RepID=A0A0N4Z1I7_PARTI
GRAADGFRIPARRHPAVRQGERRVARLRPRGGRCANLYSDPAGSPVAEPVRQRRDRPA